MVTISEIAEWIKHGKYRARVEAARGLKEIAMEGGMTSGPIVTEELPQIMPAKGERDMYTGLVLLSFHVDEGVAKLEQVGIGHAFVETMPSISSHTVRRRPMAAREPWPPPQAPQFSRLP